MKILSRPRPSMDMIMMTKRSLGKAYITSTNRMRIISSRPPVASQGTKWHANGKDDALCDDTYSHGNTRTIYNAAEHIAPEMICA